MNKKEIAAAVRDAIETNDFIHEINVIGDVSKREQQLLKKDRKKKNKELKEIGQLAAEAKELKEENERLKADNKVMKDALAKIERIVRKYIKEKKTAGTQ